jgi:hypothetical protein
MYEQIFQSTKVVQPAYGSDYWRHLTYVSTWDAFMAQSIFEWSRVFRDGTKVKFGKPSGNYTPLGRVKGFVAYCNNYGVINPAFEINGLPNPNEVLNPSWTIPSGYMPSMSVGKFVDDLNQVYLHQPNANRLDIYDLGTGVKLDEINHNAGEYFQSIAWVQPGQVVGLCKTNGKTRIMDYLSSPRVLEIGLIDSFRVGAYDCAFHLFCTIGWDNKTRVYCREAFPYTLTNPVFEPATVYGLKANRVKVQLTGQGGEPAPGWWIHWELIDTGYGILGSTDKFVSLTDEDGWAQCLYFGPSDNQPGQCKIRARVVLY